MTTYMVLAHTEHQEIFYASEPDSGYSLDNLSPSVPDSVTAFAGYSNGMTVYLNWSKPVEEDFQYFVLEKSSSSDFQDYQTFETIDTFYLDLDYMLNY